MPWRMLRNTHLILRYRLGVLHVLGFHADLGSRLDFLSDVHVGIVTASHLDDDQARSKSIVPFGKRGRLSAQVVFCFSAAKRDGLFILLISISRALQTAAPRITKNPDGHFFFTWRVRCRTTPRPCFQTWRKILWEFGRAGLQTRTDSSRELTCCVTWLWTSLKYVISGTPLQRTGGITRVKIVYRYNY